MQSEETCFEVNWLSNEVKVHFLDSKNVFLAAGKTL
jgi:hypothetical protein